MEQYYNGANAPYKKAYLTASKIMQRILLALIPIGLYGIYHYGKNAGIIILTVCAGALITDILMSFLGREKKKKPDIQMLVTALILSYSMPAALSWKTGLAAGILCAVFTHGCYRLFERAVVSPVILTRLILMLTASEQFQQSVIDDISSATPLTMLKAGEAVDVLALILGNTDGCIGEGSAVLLCISGIFLILSGIIDFRVCGTYLFSFAAFMTVLGGQGLSSYYLTVQLAGGGFMLALWFIAPAYSHLPFTKGGRWLYGILLGFLTAVFRLYGSHAENLCYAFVIADLCIPILERITIPCPFGVERGKL